MALTLQDGVRVTVDLGGRSLTEQVWKAEVGRTLLYLLDSDPDDNDDALRAVTDRRYDRDSEHSLPHEMQLGTGGPPYLPDPCLYTQQIHPTADPPRSPSTHPTPHPTSQPSRPAAHH